MALNRVLDKRARYWRTDIFRQDFCAVPASNRREGQTLCGSLGFPGGLPATIIGDKKTQLLDMAISPSGAERFRKVLESAEAA